MTWEGFDLYQTLNHRQNPTIRKQIDLDDIDGPNPVLNEFVRAIQEDREPECNAADNLKSMSMVFAAVQSAREGREILISDL